MSADPITDALTGLAELLAAWDAGRWNGIGTGPAVFLRVVPQEPEECITLNSYQLAADARLSDTLTGINVRIRAGRNPNVVHGFAAAVYSTFHALGYHTLGTAPNQIKITDLYWQSEALIGPDANGRHVLSVNYYLQFNRPHARLE
jgi:hypothetical protein